MRKKYETEEERMEALRAACRRYYRKNKAVLIARSMAYQKANKDKVNAAARARYADPTSRTRMYQIRYRIEHAEEIKLKSKERRRTEDYKIKKRVRDRNYRERNREKIRKYNREWYRRNRAANTTAVKKKRKIVK